MFFKNFLKIIYNLNIKKILNFINLLGTFTTVQYLSQIVYNLITLLEISA